MRGRKPKPEHLRVIEGNPSKRPITQGPQPERLSAPPDAPEILTGDAREEWDRIAKSLHHLGLLTVVDIQPLAAYCMAYGRWVMAERELTAGELVTVTTNGNAIQNPLVGIANKAAADMVRYAAEFGLTPSARARLSIKDIESARSKFTGLIG